jgi:hypothetical protein
MRRGTLLRDERGDVEGSQEMEVRSSDGAEKDVGEEDEDVYVDVDVYVVAGEP